jgi:hypothetical protein
MKETSKYKNKKNQSKKEQESFRKKFFFSNFQRTVSNIANAAVGAGVLAIPYVSLKKKFHTFSGIQMCWFIWRTWNFMHDSFDDSLLIKNDCLLY